MDARPSPAYYRPWMKGVYEVAPGLRPFGTDFGNGELDNRLFQFDTELPRYRASKLASFAESPEKYVARSGLTSEVESSAVSLIVGRLIEEGSAELCENGLRLPGVQIAPTLENIFIHLQEDVAIVAKDASRDWIAYVNVCNPSHWLPTEKIGLSFFDAHTPVPGFERINAAAGAIVDSMIGRRPYVRFVWGLESDDQLNHHPVAPPGIDQDLWYGRQFQKGLFVRVERQVLWPLPEVSSALFFIRPYIYPAAKVKESNEEWEQLIKAYRSMSPAARRYKGLPEGLL